MLGLKTILIAHVVFNASVVALIVRARFVGMGQSLEEASYDLGAGPMATFRQVTLPQLAPAVLAGGLLAFTFSFDDFITSFFVSGAGTTTLPLRIFSSLRFGISPVINAAAVMILALDARGGRARVRGPATQRARTPHADRGTRPLMATIVFFPEGAYGPTNNCVGIGDVLRRRGHRVVFVVEESFAGTLEEKGFEEALMRLGPPPEQRRSRASSGRTSSATRRPSSASRRSSSSRGSSRRRGRR